MKLQTALFVAVFSSVGFAGSTPIGVVAARGNFNVNGSRIWGNSTLFDGARVETADASSELSLSGGIRVQLGAASTAQIFQDRMELGRGTGQVNAKSPYRVNAAGMTVVREREAKAALAEEVSGSSRGKVMADQASLAAGAAVFGARCASCHQERAQGLIGPNLTDDAWIHGKGTLVDIYGTVNAGVLDKGMPAWGRQLSPSELRTVVAFVGTLRGTHVPGKAAEGTPIAPSAE